MARRLIMARPSKGRGRVYISAMDKANYRVRRDALLSHYRGVNQSKKLWKNYSGPVKITGKRWKVPISRRRM